ncbi:hypothetical protein J6590_025611 [Homalodisca vitripennis]|nr:hypothetical protein J6590_025611 [Homalodisca vitripennis]
MIFNNDFKVRALSIKGLAAPSLRVGQPPRMRMDVFDPDRLQATQPVLGKHNFTAPDACHKYRQNHTRRSSLGNIWKLGNRDWNKFKQNCTTPFNLLDSKFPSWETLVVIAAQDLEIGFSKGMSTI